MNRREMIGSVASATTHVLFPSILSGFISGCTSNDDDLLFFSKGELEVIKEIIDLILPANRTASASQVHTHYFLDEVFAKCLAEEQQTLIKEGMTHFIHSYKSADNKLGFLTGIDQKAYAGEVDYAWFIPIKQYTIIGFFTSQEGTTKASNYVPVPGDYQGEIPLEESTLNYGLTALRYYL